MKIGHYILHLSVLRISFAFATLAAFIVGLLAAYYWFKASKIEIDPGWRGGSPQSAADARRPVEPGESQLSESMWLNATMEAAAKSAGFNRRAAGLTAVAVALGALSSILGALVGFCSPQ